MKLPVRQPVAGGSARRSQRVAVTFLARAAGALLVVVAGVAMYWLTSADDFGVDPAAVTISGLVHASETDARDRLALPAGRPNIFRLRPSAMAEALRGLPAVASAEVLLELPNRINVRVTERQPLLVWRTPNAAFLVDLTGVLIAHEVAASGLPALQDRRLASAQLELGQRLGQTDMEAVRLLLTITPADIGSRAASLSLIVGDEDGFELQADNPAWRAVFGFYTATLRRPAELVPRQRQCLASWLAGREERLEAVYLSVAGEGCGTYRERPTPSARFSQNVGRLDT